MGTLNLDAALIPGRGNVLIGDDTTPFVIPSHEDLVAYAANYSVGIPGFSTIGHTDPEDLPEWDSDGGDSEMLRTWEVENAREVVEPETQWFVAKPLQHDNDVMRLYFGGGQSTAVDRFTAPVERGRLERPALIVYIDKGTIVGECLERASIRGDGPREYAIDEWGKIPLRFTRLAPVNGAGSGYHFIGEHFGTQAESAPAPAPAPEA